MTAHRRQSIVDAVTIDPHVPSIFEVDMPTIEYGDDPSPDEAHRALRQAHRLAPIAMGPLRPEVLDYDLVRTVLRDSRFLMPEGIALVFQGISSGPVWDRVCNQLLSMDGEDHQRLRRLVARAFNPRAAERMRAACTDVITALVDGHAGAGRCDVVTDIARPYPIPIICALLGAPREGWETFSEWAIDISNAFGMNVAAETPAIIQAWEQCEAYFEDMIAKRRETPCRRSDLRAHPRGRRRRRVDARRGDHSRCHPAQRGNRYHTQPVGRRHRGAVRPSGPGGAVGRETRTGAQRGGGAHCATLRSISGLYEKPS
jgi:cytochrome P450